MPLNLDGAAERAVHCSNIPQFVPHFVAFGAEVVAVVLGGGDFDGELLNDLHALDFEAVHLLGLVGEDAKLA